MPITSLLILVFLNSETLKRFKLSTMVSPPLLLIPDCPAPFINQALYPASKGCKSAPCTFKDSLLTRLAVTAGRICSPIGANTTCCLPCPSLDWFYPDNFYHQTRYAGFIATASLSLCLFMLITWLVLPPEKTKRHHLNMSLVASLLLMEVRGGSFCTRDPCSTDAM